MNSKNRKQYGKLGRRAQRKQEKQICCTQQYAGDRDQEYLRIRTELGLKPDNPIHVIFRHWDQDHEDQLLQQKAVLFPDNDIFDMYYTIDNPGHVCVYDKELGQVVFAIKCTPIMDLDDNVADFEKMFQHLHHDLIMHRECTSNGPQVTGGMWAMGWRPGYERGQAFNTYFYPKKGKKPEEWNALREEDYSIHTLYGKRFFDMAPTYFSRTKDAVHQDGTPIWGYQQYMPSSNLDDFCFAANLRYTKTKGSTSQTFSNRPHKDKDGSPYTFGIWGLMNMDGNLVPSRKGAMKNGFFYVTPYKIKVAFDARTDCIWEMIWRGKTDAHATVIAEMETGYQWLGSSAQTSQSLIDRVHRCLA